jgi:predicted amidohydrolase YtcJ
MDDRDAVDALWSAHAAWAFPLASMLEAGVELAFGSDAPVTPLDPWRGIAAAVTRSRDGREPWYPEQCIDVEDALEASTRSRLAIGQPADLIALDVDPLECDGEQLRTMPVALTLVAGRVTHSTLS